MTNPQQLISLAREEVARRGRGKPQQVRLRRAVSTSYYAVFHHLCWASARTFGSNKSWKSSAIIYRALNHGEARKRCQESCAKPLSASLQHRLGIKFFPDEIRTFCEIFVALQSQRHECDYNPDFWISSQDAEDAIVDAERAMEALDRSDDVSRKLLLTHLVFGARQ
jgi:uncharacterized protein (UPF0332 family)